MAFPMASSMLKLTGAPSKRTIPACTLIARLLIPVPYAIDQLNWLSLVNGPPANFNPSVRLERELLGSQHHLRCHAMTSKQTGHKGSALQAHHSLGVADAG